jgi:fibronectin-binding autotransporter adhesin
LTGTGSVFGVQFGIGFTLIAGTSTFTASGASILFQFVGGMTFYNLVFTGLSPKFVAAASASCTVNNLTITGTAVKTGAVALGGGSSTGGGTITVAGTLTIAGNSVTNRLLVQSGGGNTTNVGVWTGASMGDCQGNSGITFDPSVMQTRSGAGGNWSTAANWTSRVPLPQDDVVVGAGASGTITLDMSRGGRSINYTGFAGTLTHSVLVSTFGNLTFSAGMTITNSNIILSGRGAYTLTTAGQALLNNFAVAAPGGTYTFADNLVVATGSLVCSFGSLTTMYNVTAQYFSLLTTGTITFGPGTWTTTQTTIGSVVTVGATTIVSAASSTIVIGGAGSALRTFAGAGKTYGNLVYTVAASTGALAITGVNTFGMITIGSARTVTFPSGATTSVGGLSIRGVSGSPTTVNSSTPGTQATISSPAGVVAACDWLVLQDSKTAGGAAFYAGADSINVSDNTGWNFTSVALIVMSCAASSSASMTVTPPAQLALASSATSGGVRANFSATVVTSQTFEAASAAQTSMTAVAQ